MIKRTNAIKVKLEESELALISRYCKKMFPKEDIMARDTQWKSKSNRNPNETGIIGEWVYYKLFSKTHITLKEYLKKRPRYRSDEGDGILDSGMVVDIKTRYFANTIENMWNREYYTARVEEKHIDKKFIDMFIFVHVYPEQGMAYIIGWIDREDYFKKARLIKNKGGVVRSGMPDINWYQVHYRELRPIEEINENKICEIEI